MQRDNVRIERDGMAVGFLSRGLHLLIDAADAARGCLLHIRGAWRCGWGSAEAAPLQVGGSEAHGDFLTAFDRLEQGLLSALSAHQRAEYAKPKGRAT
jgi:hypothetical protein